MTTDLRVRATKTALEADLLIGCLMYHGLTFSQTRSCRAPTVFYDLTEKNIVVCNPWFSPLIHTYCCLILVSFQSCLYALHSFSKQPDSGGHVLIVLRLCTVHLIKRP